MTARKNTRGTAKVVMAANHNDTTPMTKKTSRKLQLDDSVRKMRKENKGKTQRMRIKKMIKIRKRRGPEKRISKTLLLMTMSLIMLVMVEGDLVEVVEVDMVHQEVVLEKVDDTTSSWTQTLDLHNMTKGILQEGVTCDTDLP